MRGEITGLDAGGHVATIKHEAIQGFMGAMTMGYPVKDAAEFRSWRWASRSPPRFIRTATTSGSVTFRRRQNSPEGGVTA